MDITFDSNLDELEQLLEAARARPYKVRTSALNTAAEQVKAEAKAIVATYDTDSTGELESVIDIDGTPASRRIFAEVRQGFFLEYGTPTTGGPRPWLTGPARTAANDLLNELAAGADIW